MDRCFFNNDRLFLNSKIKMKVKFATIFMLWITVLPLFAQKSSDAQIIHTISKAASAVTSMKCSFVQTKHMRLLNEKMVSKGKMYYQKSDKLRWEYVSPYNYTFILNGSNVLLKNKKRTDVIDVNQNKLFKEIAQIMMSSVVGHNLSDDKSFKTKISETSVEYVASMTPLRKNMKQMFKTIVIHFNKKALSCILSHIVVYEKLVVEKIVSSGINLTLVPVLLVVPTFLRGLSTLPPSLKLIVYSAPSLLDVTIIHLERALTTLAPTP